MRIQNISFTSQKMPEQRENNRSSLYNKQNFVRMGVINDFIVGSALSFGILESRSKFKLLKPKVVHLLPNAKFNWAKKSTKRNILLGLGIGALYAALDLVLFNKLAPKIEKTYDKLEEIKSAQN